MNYCETEYDRVEAMGFEHYAYKMLDLAMMYTPRSFPRRAVDINFLDADVKIEDYNDGFHEWGRTRSLIQIRVWPRDVMPDAAVRWLICHEIWHVKQSTLTEFQGEDETLPHDDIPSERDANKWATGMTGFDGEAWWRDFVTLQCKDV